MSAGIELAFTQVPIQSPSSSNPTLAAYLRDCEREFIMRALEEHQWRVTETADALGISRKNL